ncbi:MAG TPA: hypothetical protein VMA75_00495 [Candidatus Paceibacterota bacterium]|nr:hypothetical protein [Candidatus Paceibacterota bacterium]
MNNALPKLKEWWRNNWFDFLKFFIPVVVALFLGAMQIAIDLQQGAINSQLRDLSYLKYFSPSIGETFDSQKLLLTLTNHGESSIYVDEASISGKTVLFPIQQTIFPDNSINIDLHPVIAELGFPQNSSTLDLYNIFFTTTEQSSSIYSGTLLLWINTMNGLTVKVPIQNISIQELGTSNFMDVYDAVTHTKPN